MWLLISINILISRLRLTSSLLHIRLIIRSRIIILRRILTILLLYHRKCISLQIHYSLLRIYFLLGALGSLVMLGYHNVFLLLFVDNFTVFVVGFGFYLWFFLLLLRWLAWSYDVFDLFHDVAYLSGQVLIGFEQYLDLQWICTNEVHIMAFDFIHFV